MGKGRANKKVKKFTNLFSRGVIILILIVLFLIVLGDIENAIAQRSNKKRPEIKVKICQGEGKIEQGMIIGTNCPDVVGVTSRADNQADYIGITTLNGPIGKDGNPKRGSSWNDPKTQKHHKDVEEVKIGGEARCKDAVDKLVVSVRGGNDIVDIPSCPREIWVFAGSGNDVVRTGPSNDKIFGQNGDDSGKKGEIVGLDGGLGNDEICGGTGKDKLYGRANDDVLKGEAGIDTVRPGKAEDDGDKAEGNAPTPEKDNVQGCTKKPEKDEEGNIIRAIKCSNDNLSPALTLREINCAVYDDSWTISPPTSGTEDDEEDDNGLPEVNE